MLVGDGVLRHDLALTGALARALGRETGLGIDVESLIAVPMTTQQCHRVLAARAVSGVDAIVLLLERGRGRFDALEVQGQVRDLVQGLLRRTSPTCRVTIVLPPGRMTELGDEHAFADAARAGADGLARIAQWPDRLAVEAPAERYAVWGDLIAKTVAETLSEPSTVDVTTDALDDRKRRAAVHALGRLDGAWEGAFGRIVTFARRAYGAHSAAVSVIDHEHTRYLARQGVSTLVVPREQSICDLALRTHGGVIVGDAAADDRFSDFPLVRSGDVRFYAGYRITSHDGTPIGALCVFDPEPRPVLTQDLALLRDFAIAAERRIWDLAQVRIR